MAKTDFKTFEEYHSIFPEEIQSRLNAVRKVIKDTAPDAEEVISYQIPAYRYHGYLIYYSAYKGHISLSYPYSKELLEAFAEELKGYKLSKSALQFPHKDPLPLDLIRQIVLFRMKENEDKQKAKRKS